MKIANIELGERALLLAPMEDVTDPSFRYMCKRFGADMVYTEFISSDGLIRDAAKSLKKLEIDDAERPVGIQIYGHLIDPMVEAARMAEAACSYRQCRAVLNKTVLFFPADIKNNLCLTAKVIFGTPEGTRTPDLLVRSQSLYPAELPARTHSMCSNILPQRPTNCKHFFRKSREIFRSPFGA